MSFTAGEILRAADLNPLFDAWTSYSPSWTASTTNPAIGNGSIVGAYRQVGKTVDVYIKISMGSTTTYGTGNWAISLPVVALRDDAGYGDARDNSTAAGYAISAQIAASGSIFRMHTGAGANVTATAPMTWANGDSLVVRARYEVA